MESNSMGVLPRDVIIEILSRLPVKVLCKFRCVSKQWLRLISDDACFTSRHRHHSRNNPLLLFRTYCSSCEIKDEEKHKVMVDLTSVDMEGASVGKMRALTCGPIYTFTTCGHLIFLRCMYSIYVCNPGTREFLGLPCSSVAPYYTVGFGHLPGCDEYKIVHLFFQESFVSDERMGCEVFTLRDGEGVDSGSWKRVKDCPYRVWTDQPPVCVSGVIYWLVSEQVRELNNKCLVFFDLKKEEFGALSYPGGHSAPDSNSSLFLMCLNRCLCLVHFSSRTSTIDIWKLKDCSSSSIWVKEHSINIFPIAGNSGIAGLVPSDDYNGEIWITSEQKGLACYNIKDKSFRSIDNSYARERYKKPCLYHESFFSLHRKQRLH